MLTKWTPIHEAGDNGAAITYHRRQGIINRLQDGLMEARAKRVVTVHRPKVWPASTAPETPVASDTVVSIAIENFTWGNAIEEKQSDFILDPTFWSGDKLGRVELGYWSSGEERLNNPSTRDGGYDGDRATFYGIELREKVDNSGERADYDDAFKWCIDWLASRRTNGLGIAQNDAWTEFHRLPQHINMDREYTFRPAFRDAKAGKSK